MDEIGIGSLFERSRSDVAPAPEPLFFDCIVFIGASREKHALMKPADDPWGYLFNRDALETRIENLKRQQRVWEEERIALVALRHAHIKEQAEPVEEEDPAGAPSHG